MLKKDYSNTIIIILIMILVFILIYPTVIINEVQSALTTFSTKYFPAVFPIYIITDLLINYHFPEKMASILEKWTQKILHSDGNCAFIIIMSMLSGFPSGAKYTNDLLQKKLISLDSANYLITFTHFSNPLFILGTCFLITQNRILTIGILISHFLANFIIAIIIRPKERGTIKKSHSSSLEKSNPFITTLTDSIFKTFRLMLMILGTSIIFFVLSGILSIILPINHFDYFLTGLLELTKGIQTIPNKLSLFNKATVILTFLSFGSISIHMQVLSIIKNTNIHYRNFLLGRICQAGISILLFYLFAFSLKL